MNMGIAAILLAAGNSRRFGAANKLLAQIGGQPFIPQSREGNRLKRQTCKSSW